MKLSHFAKKMMKASNCEIIICQDGRPIKQPISAAVFENKLNHEILEDFTVLSFMITDNQLIFNIK